MRWQLREVAARRGVRRPAEMHRLLMAHGFELNLVTVTRLFSEEPTEIRFDDLEAICTALDCLVGELIVPGTNRCATLAPLRPRQDPVRPLRRSGRSTPP